MAFPVLRRLPGRLLAGIHDLLPELLPATCALCNGASTQALCDRCQSRYFRTRRHRCIQCAVAMTDTASARCGHCLKSPPAFDTTIAVADYEPPVDQLVLSLKFGASLALAPQFARMLHAALTISACASRGMPDLLTAVPLGERRLAQRGFNQAAEIVKPLARLAGVARDVKLMARVRETEAQSLLHPDQRRKNVHGAFAVAPHAAGKLAGRHIAVVDDVLTTGETLNEVAAMLKRHGATRVTNLVFARTPPK